MNDLKLPSRSTIILNYLSLVALVIMGNILPGYKTQVWFVALLAVSSVVWAVTYFAAYLQTGLWKLVHKVNGYSPIEISESTGSIASIAYQIYTISLLSIAVIAIIIQRDWISVGPIEIVAALYFAHVLPASILVWRKRSIDHEN